MPEVCVSRLNMVTLSHAAGASAIYFFTGSSTFSFPRSSSNRMQAAVNCLVIEPSRNLLAGEFATSHSRFANPYPLLHARDAILRQAGTHQQQRDCNPSVHVCSLFTGQMISRFLIHRAMFPA